MARGSHVTSRDDDEPCFGSCIGLDTDFVGEPRGRPDASQPNGGWGFMPCCGNRVHFDCLGRWLTPDDPANGTLVESTHGLVPINLKCPFCKRALSKSRSRMLSA